LVDYGVRRIVDLRFDSELATDPPQALPVEVVHVSVLPDADSNHWTEIDALGDAAPDTATATRDVYLEFLERFGANFARAVEAVGGAPEGAVLIHCLAGKDRTGLLTALLLLLAEVPIAEVAADYALSAERLVTWSTPWIEGAENEEERRRRTRISQTPGMAMIAVLEELERRHGGVREYLSTAGLEEVTAQRIQERLLG